MEYAIFDIQTKLFGDETYTFIENDEKFRWKISFVSCYKVSYETDVNWRTIDNVEEMKDGQLGYDGQNISLIKYEEFVECSLDLSIMVMNIVCKDILVERVKV